MEGEPFGGRRYSVKFSSDDIVTLRPRPIKTEAARLARAMALLEELRLADFMPEEFHDEHDALLDGWTGN